MFGVPQKEHSKAGRARHGRRATDMSRLNNDHLRIHRLICFRAAAFNASVNTIRRHPQRQEGRSFARNDDWMKSRAGIAAQAVEVGPNEESLETLVHRCKVAIELHDVEALLQHLGLAGRSARHRLLTALEQLQEMQGRPAGERKQALVGSFLLFGIPETKRAACADVLIELQNLYYIQRLIDLFEA